MSCLIVFLVFQVGCGEIFPGVVILGFVLVGEEAGHVTSDSFWHN
jgi:hypothetical protein